MKAQRQLAAAPQEEHEEESAQSEEKVPLTSEEEVYLKEYLEGLREQEQGTEKCGRAFCTAFTGRCYGTGRAVTEISACEQPKWRLK